MTNIDYSAGVDDIMSFSNFINEMKTDDTVVFANSAMMLCVLDYLNDGLSCKLSLTKTSAFEDIMYSNEVYMTPLQFSQFIDNRRFELVDPDQENLKKIVLNMVVKETIDACCRFVDGDESQLYTSSMQINAGPNSDIEFPKVIRFLAPVYKGGSHVSINALLRCRILERGINIKFSVQDEERVLATANERAVDHILKVCDVPVFTGFCV